MGRKTTETFLETALLHCHLGHNSALSLSLGYVGRGLHEGE